MNKDFFHQTKLKRSVYLFDSVIPATFNEPWPIVVPACFDIYKVVITISFLSHDYAMLQPSVNDLHLQTKVSKMLSRNSVLRSGFE